MKYYLAYGSNLNKEQMQRRCPGAQVVGTSWIPGYALVFRRGYLTIEPGKGYVDVGVYAITREDEKQLDRYEGFPTFYHKEEFTVPGPYGGGIRAMAYVMNDGFPLQAPSEAYLRTVIQGYHDFQFTQKAEMDLLRAARLTTKLTTKLLT